MGPQPALRQLGFRAREDATRGVAGAGFASLGDPWYAAPHLFIREGAGPYAGGPFFRKVDIRGGNAELEADKRRSLFPEAGELS